MQVSESSTTPSATSGSGMKLADDETSAAVSDIIINEALCFITDKFVKSSVVQLKAVICSFYSENELVCAKDILIGSVEGVQKGLLPRYGKRRGESRVKGTVDDVFEILSLVDENQLMDKLPRFAAIKLDRIPCIKIDDMEIFTVVSKMKSIEDRLSAVEALSGGKDILKGKLSDFENRIGMCEKAESANLSTSAVISKCGSRTDNNDSDQVAGPSFADVANRLGGNEASGFTVVQRKKPVVHRVSAANIKVAHGTKGSGQRVHIFGSKESHTGSHIKSGIAIAHKSVMHIDNLDTDCTPESLTHYVEKDLNVKVVSCFTSKSWMREKDIIPVTAFRLCVDSKDKDTIFSSLNWPMGVVVRDWIFKPKRENGDDS
jgi:hypothetical protein